MHRVHRGLWAPAGSAAELRTRCLGALAVLPPGSAISHGSAAALWRLPLPDPRFGHDLRPPPTPDPEDAGLAGPLHVRVVGPAQPRIRGLRVHRVSAPRPAVEIEPGLVVTSPARTWFDLAGVLARDDLVIAGDVLLGRGLAEQDEIAALIRAGDGARGVRGARRAVALLDAGAASPMETRLRLLLVDYGFTGFEVNRAVHDSVGGWLCRPDIQFPRRRVAIEYEGDHHRTDKEQWRSDIRRYEVLRENGWVVIRLVAPDILRTPHLSADRIRRELDRPAADRDPP